MKRFTTPEMKILSVRLSENIAASGNSCPMGLDSYSSNQQQCQKCKLYYQTYASFPSGIDISSDGLITFCEKNNLPYTDRNVALAAAAALSCPAGLG